MHISQIQNNPILRLTLEFSVIVIDYCELLQAERKFVICNQLLRSGTSIGANAFEAQNAESKRDFIHKLKISAKEADETPYWLTICEIASQYPTSKNLSDKLTEIQKVLNSILGTAKGG